MLKKYFSMPYSPGHQIFYVASFDKPQPEFFFYSHRGLNLVLTFDVNDICFGYFRLFIVATGCLSERRPQKTVSCYGG